MDEQVQQQIEAAIRPLVERLSSLEMVCTILSNKLNDAQCRLALERFIKGTVTEWENPPSSAEPTEGRPSSSAEPTEGRPSAAAAPAPVAAVNGSRKTVDLVREYFQVLETKEPGAARKVADIARYVGKTYQIVNGALSYNSKQFERVGEGLWRLRQGEVAAPGPRSP